MRSATYFACQAVICKCSRSEDRCACVIESIVRHVGICVNCQATAFEFERGTGLGVKQPGEPGPSPADVERAIAFVEPWMIEKGLAR